MIRNPGGTTSGASSTFKSGAGTASIAGTAVAFTAPPMANATYSVSLPAGVDYRNPTTNADTRTINGFTAFAAEDGVDFTYIAAVAQ